MSARDREELRMLRLLARLQLVAPRRYIRPKGMHQRTFESIVQRASVIDAKVAARWGAVAEQMAERIAKGIGVSLSKLFDEAEKT